MTSTLRTCALATAMLGALAGGGAQAAVRMTEALDGNWFDPAQSGRGIMIDYIPNARVLFGAIFSYDNAGAPFWLVIQSNPLGEFDTQFQTSILRIDSGTWANPAPASVSTVGTATVAVNSCNEIVYALDMTPDSGLADVGFTFQPLQGANPAACAYQHKFAGCPSFAAAAPAFGDRACQIGGDFLAQDITLTNEITWVIEGKVGIGGDNAQSSTLRIEPGTLLVSTGDTFDHIAVSRGSKIFAEGTRDFPIVLTSPEELPGFSGDPQPKDVGGIVLAGNAPANCVPNCVAEWDPTLLYGGSDPSDSSGVLRYVQVRYAGFVFASNRELNSFTLAGAGSGTVLDHLQSFQGADDAIEFFGGTANVRHFVSTCPGDDTFDWDEGYQGKIQFGLVQQQGCSGEDHGMELANSPTNFDASPRAQGKVANLTLLGNPQATRTTDGVQLKEGSAGNFWNLAVGGFTRSCIALQDLPTFTAAGTPQSLSGLTTIQNTVIGCATNYRTSPSDAPYTSQAWFEAQAGNAAAAGLGLGANGLGPAAGSPLLGKPFNPTDDWFQPTDYAGAFASDRDQDNWTLGWTTGVND